MWKTYFSAIGILVCWNICHASPFHSLPLNLLKHDKLQESVNFPDPEASMTMEQVVAYHGYPLEEYDILSEDGYYTTIQRIPHGKNNTNVTNREPVIIMHGLGGLASIWVVNVPDQNLAYILAEAGYDVWLANARGSAYSLRHKTFTPKQKQFWEFSFQEMAYYDMPATIDFILNKTGQHKVHYIGHSMGTTISFAMLSSRPDYNKKVYGVYDLAPVTFLENTTDSLVKLGLREELIDWLLTALHIYYFNVSNVFLQDAFERLCGKPIQLEVCAFIFNNLDRKDFARINLTRGDVFLHLTPSSMSVQTVAHYGQIFKFNAFQEYDWGKEKNEIKYGQPTPPPYNLTKVVAPVALFSGPGDETADPTDVARLRALLPNVVLNYPVPDPGFTHLDFMWGQNVVPLVYVPMMKLMKQLSSNETWQM